jgi:predicted short-subunit dehydrogenase-like oxidoreductase (DUF2520 family)
MLSRWMSQTLSMVGAGRVGKILAKRLRESGWSIGAVVTRSAATSRAAVRTIGAGTAHASLSPEVWESDVVLLATPDTALAAVARSLAQLGGKGCRGKIVLHASGAFGGAILEPLARLGASTGSLHPMQTFSGRGTPRLAGVTFAVEGDRGARLVARKIARALGGVPVTIDGAAKPAYHAAGVMVAGHALALVEAATQVLMKLGFSRSRARKTLLPVMRQMIDNFDRLGPRASWTGPVARGDYAAVARHMNALRSYPREFRQSYAALALLGARVLSNRSASACRRLERALKNS